MVNRMPPVIEAEWECRDCGARVRRCYPWDTFHCVRAGAAEIYERLRIRFGDDPDTSILYDRRQGGTRRSRPHTPVVERRRGERRLPQDPSILASRGFFVTRRRECPPAR
jgi:hypothetical protein